MVYFAVLLRVRQAKHPLRDDIPLDLRGAALDGIGPRAEPFARELEIALGKARSGPAESRGTRDLLPKLVARLLQFSRNNLEDGGFGPRISSGLRFLRDAIESELKSFFFHPKRGDLLAHHGVLEPLSIPIKMMPSFLDELALAASGLTSDARADIGTLVLKQGLPNGPAVADLPDDVADRNANVLEEGLAERRRAADEIDVANGNSLTLHIDEEEGDSALLAILLTRAHEAKDPIALIRMRRPGLLTVDDELVAVALGLHLHIGKIGAGVRFRIALTPADLTTRDLREVLVFLLLVSELEERRADHREPKTNHRTRKAEGTHLFVEDGRMLPAEAGAAIFFGPSRRREAALITDIAPFEHVGIDGRMLLPTPVTIERAGRGCAAKRSGRVGLEELADFHTE